MKTYTVEYAVMEHYALVFEYGDYSGLTNEEITEYEEWLESVEDWLIEYYGDGVSHYHFSIRDSLGFGRCEITECLGNLVEVHLVVFLKD